MKKIKTIMGMLVIIDIVDASINKEIFKEVFNYLNSIDKRFSPYKKNSEVTLYNNKKIDKKNLSGDFKKILSLSSNIKKRTNGFFDILYKNRIDPSGLVKGWAINNSKILISEKGYKNFYIEIAGDIEVVGLNHNGKKWAIGIRNPFNKKENIKIVYLSNKGIATSGTYERGNHIYNPLANEIVTEIKSITVIGPNIYEADCFATASFAMGINGINFLEKLKGFEGYMIDNNGIATFTTNFEKYLK